MIVEVYRNIRARNWSVRDAKTKKVIAHAEEAAIRNATFHVSQSGRQRVLHQKRKNVHAWAKGELIQVTKWSNRKLTPLRPHDCDVQVWYDPYKTDSFTVMETGKPIEFARLVIFTTKGVYAIP